MKKMNFILAALMLVTMTASAADAPERKRVDEHAKKEALAITRQLDDALNLTRRQFERALEVNYDFIVDFKNSGHRSFRLYDFQHNRALMAVLTQRQLDEFLFMLGRHQEPSLKTIQPEPTHAAPHKAPEIRPGRDR